MQRKRKCYLAGPMRSKPEFNYPAFMEGAAALRAKGWDVFNPAEMDIEEGDVTEDLLELSIEEQKCLAGTPANARRFAWRDVKCLIKKLLAERGDAIVLLPDWQESVGANAERAVAIWVGLKVLTLEEALNE